MKRDRWSKKTSVAVVVRTVAVVAVDTADTKSIGADSQNKRPGYPHLIMIGLDEPSHFLVDACG